MRVAGIGFRGGATLASLQDALLRATAGGPPVLALATEKRKADAPVFKALGAALELPCIPVETSEIAQVDTPTQSPRVQAQFATGSLAEAAALVAAGAGARLVAARSVSGDNMATAAIAVSEGIKT